MKMMESTPKAQAVELIKQAESVLILTHVDPDGDALGSALAMHLTLQKLGKKPETVLFGQINQTFAFLPAFDQIKTQLNASNDLVITIDTRSTGEDLALGYRKLPEERRIKIVITPPKGTLAPEDVLVERSLPKFDLVLFLDCSSLEQSGTVAQTFPDLFFETPTVSIDHHATNNHFAKVNWVDLTATSTAEMLVSFIESLGRDEPLLDADIATTLLTGLITDTGSFQNFNTTPKSLTVAAQLVAAGAQHHVIMEKIKTRTLSTLKLWGKALANIQPEPQSKFIWTSLSEAEMQQAGAEGQGTEGLIDELLKTVADVDFVMLLTEKEGNVRGSLRSVEKSFDVTTVAKLFGGGGHKAASGFQVKGSLAEKKADIVNSVRQLQLGAAKSLTS